MINITEEIVTVSRAAGEAGVDFDVDEALVDCSLLALNDIISSVHLQVYLGRELVREHAYVIADTPLQAWGPPPSEPPDGPVPDGARVRLTVAPNPHVARETRDEWFRRLGWVTAEPLEVPPGSTRHTYGAFASGGYGVERQLLVNPKYDRPVGGSDMAPAKGGAK